MPALQPHAAFTSKNSSFEYFRWITLQVRSISIRWWGNPFWMKGVRAGINQQSNSTLFIRVFFSAMSEVCLVKYYTRLNYSKCSTVWFKPPHLWKSQLINRQVGCNHFLQTCLFIILLPVLRDCYDKIPKKINNISYKVLVLFLKRELK